MILKDFKNRLEERIKENENVFITPHLEADFDAIASAIGLALIAKKFNKPTYIIIADNLSKIDASIKLIIEEYKDKVEFINMDKYAQLKGQKDLLICTDVNKKERVGCEKYLDDFNDIVIIDHHKKGETSINSDTEMILEDVSSISEVIPDLLCMFGIRYDKLLATYLLAGIYLDTDKLRKNVSPKTHHMIGRLLEKGGDLNRVNEFFEEDFLSDRNFQSLVDKANFFGYTIVVACNQDENAFYTKEEIAKAADYALRFKVDASIAIGKVENDVVSVSARSKGKVDVSELMSKLGGGGNQVNAAAKIEGSSIQEVNEKVLKLIRPSFYSN